MIFNFLIYFSLHITKAKSRNKQLRHYEGNWATYEILKRFFKSKRCYKKRISSADDNDSDSDGKDAMPKDDEESDGDIYENGGGKGEGDGNREGEGNDNGEGEGNDNGEGDGDGGEEGEGDGGEDAVDSWNGKGKGKAKAATGSKRKMPQRVGNSKKRRL